MADKNNSWVLPRHQFMRNSFYPWMSLAMKKIYNITVDKFDDIDNRPYFIMYNHQTPSDQFFVGMACHTHLYYVATEDIFSLGLISSGLRWAVNPIPIKKSTNDLRAVRNCIRVAKEGGSIAIAPEGNRTYSGCTETIKPSIVKLVKAAKLPVAFFKIEGGSASAPRWSNEVRKGPVHAHVTRVVEPEEYLKMSEDEFYELITRELAQDDYLWAEEHGYTYPSKSPAENIERLIYICPSCGLSEFKSKKDLFSCLKCGRTWKFNDDLSIEEISVGGVASGESEASRSFSRIKEWYDYQQDFINELDPNSLGSEAVYSEHVELSEVIPYKDKELIAKDSLLTIYKNRLEIRHDGGTLLFGLKDIESIAVMGRSKLNIYTNEKIYQVKGGVHFNPVKYMHLHYRYINLNKGDEVIDKFLGL